MASDRKRFLIWISILPLWLCVFVIHAYVHVRSLTGQCCGYEGDPGFLRFFFLLWPGLLYFGTLLLVLLAGLFMFVWPLPKE